MKLLKFESKNCGQCKLMKPVLESLKAENPKLEVVVIDVEENPVLAKQFGVRSLPTMILTTNGGDVITEFLGYTDGNKIQKVIDSYGV